MNRFTLALLGLLLPATAWAADTVPYISGTGGLTSGNYVTSGATVGQLTDGGVVQTPTAGSGTTHTMGSTTKHEYWFCTGTCTVTMPVPAAGYEFCVATNVGVTAAITLAAIGSSAMYGKTDQSAYGTAGTGTAVSTSAAGNKICLVGLDTTHYNVGAYNGSWTMN